MWEKGSLLENKKRILQQKIGGRHVASQEPSILSRFYSDFIQIYPNFIQVISRFYHNFILILSLFYLDF